MHNQGKPAPPQATSEHRERQHTPLAQNTTTTTTTGRQHQPTTRSAAPNAPPAQLEAKPVFTRGVSMFDQTAVTSAAPTPAGEISNPMSFGMGRSIDRQRESHLPDEDLLRVVRAMSTTQRARPGDEGEGEVEGEDEFGEDLSRRETEKAR